MPRVPSMICPTCTHDNLPGNEQCVHCLQDLTYLDRPTAYDRVERSLLEDPVRILKPRAPVTLPPTATVGEAIRTMLEQDLGAVLVVDELDHVIGIFSERDLLTRVAGLEDYAARPLRDFMTRAPETVRPEDALAFALHKMDSGGYRHLPVIKDGLPLGMVSVRDMLRHITRLCGGQK
jgi:CBS domain-containing protein